MRLPPLALATVLAMASLFAFGTSSAAAAPCTSADGATSWATAVSGDFNDSTKWTNGAPSADCDASITVAGTYTVTIGLNGGTTDSRTVKALTVGGASGTQTLNIHGINGTGDITLTAASVTNNANGSILIDCQTPATPCSGGLGTLQVTSGALTNAGTITTTARGATAQLNGNITNNGAMQINDAATFNQGTAPSPVTLTNQGSLALANGSTLTTNQTVTNGTGGAINATGTGTLTGGLTFNEGAGTTSGTAPVQITNGGTLNFTGTGASSFRMYKGGTYNLSGNIAASQSLTIRNVNFTGDTLVAAATGFTNAGTIVIDCQTSVGDPCASPGTSTLQITSGTLTNSGTITTSTGAATAALNGNITNTGTMQINNAATFSPPAASPVTLLNQGTLGLADGATLTTNQTVTNGAGGAINATGTGMLTGGMTFNEGAGTTSGATPVRITNGGSLNFTGTGASKFELRNNTNLSGNIAAGQTIVNHGVGGTGDNSVTAATGFTNAGTIVFDCAGTCTGGLNNLTVTSGTLTNTGAINANGQSGSVARLSGNVTNASGALFTATNTVQVGFGGGTFVNQGSGVIGVSSGANLDVSGAAGGLLSITGGLVQGNGSGTITGSVNNSGGSITPNTALTISANYTQGSGGNLNVNVTGTGAGQVDVLNVGATATLDGSLSLIPSAGYTCAAQTGDRFKFLGYGARAGQFASTSVNPPLANGRPFTLDYAPTNEVDAVVGAATSSGGCASGGSGGGAAAQPPAQQSGPGNAFFADINGQFAPGGRFSVGGTRTVGLLDGGAGLDVTTRGSCNLGWSEIGVPIRRSAASKRRARRKRGRKRGLIKRGRLRVLGAGHHTIRLRPTAKGRRKLRKIARRLRRLHRKRRRSRAGASATGVYGPQNGLGDELRISCRPVSFPPVTPTAGGGITGGPGSGPATPAGPAVVHDTAVTIPPPPPPISEAKTFVRYDSVGDKATVIFAPGGKRIKKLVAVLRVRCQTSDANAGPKFTSDTIKIEASDIPADIIDPVNIKYYEHQDNPTLSLQVWGTSTADDLVDLRINQNASFPRGPRESNKDCDSSGAPGSGVYDHRQPPPVIPPPSHPPEGNASPYRGPTGNGLNVRDLIFNSWQQTAR